ncbi:MAG: hypothetical protein A2Y89_02695 [Chloroflexi bacterium RBG_13_51_18]|nr:MAG: hypothetical protein A2Y89_02695 [Chloroflexi bacterium RBG_13_51_18]
MKPTLGTPYPVDWDGRVIQMSANDREIWTYYQSVIEPDFINLYFNVGVGVPTMMSKDLDEEMITLVEHISRRRIDVVAEKESEWWLIELRYNAGPGAIGSILTYKTLWEADPPDARPVVPVIVTNTPDENLESVCRTLGITWMTV